MYLVGKVERCLQAFPPVALLLILTLTKALLSIRVVVEGYLCVVITLKSFFVLNSKLLSRLFEIGD